MAKRTDPKHDELADQLRELRRAAKLDSWNSFIEEMKVPQDLYPALCVQRTELMPKGRSLSAEECDVVYQIITTLMETNAALREHTAQTAKLVTNWYNCFRGLQQLGGRINDFANFVVVNEEEEEEV